MKTMFTVSRVCTACGQPIGSYPGRLDKIDGFELKYQLCGSCTQSRQSQCGLDLLPIDGSQTCFFCGAEARRVSHNADVFQQARHCRLHYTCPRCYSFEQAAFQRRLKRLRHDYAESPTFPVQFIIDMDAEVRQAVGSSPEAPPTA